MLSGLLELGFPLAVKVFIDDLLPAQNWGLIVLAAAALLGIYLLNTGLMSIVTYWGHMLGINIETELRRRSFDHLQKLSFSFYDNQKTGHLVARVTKDLEEVGEVAHHGPEDVFIAVMTFIGAFILMLMVNVPLALITGVIVPLVAWLTTHYGTRMTHNFRALFGRVGAFNARLEENVGGMRVVQAFANEDHERRLFAQDNGSYRDTKLQAYRLMAASTALSYLGMRLIQVVIMIAGTWLVIHGDLTNGGFISFLLLISVFFRPIEKINAIMEVYPKGIAGFRSYLDLLETEPDIADRPDAMVLPGFEHDIRYEQVSFGYDDGKPVLRNIDPHHQCRRNRRLRRPVRCRQNDDLLASSALLRAPHMGGSRSTAWTFAISPWRSLRRRIGIVQQDVFLFAGTIRENVAYGRLNASEADIRRAVRNARLEDLIAALPAGLDTVIGERGVKLSGGQKQRLAIARIFLKDPPILILDEATSALDTETEREIQLSLAALSEGRTTLMIAHRLATIRDADRIVVVTEDGIAEQGRHRELLAAKGIYKRLHDTQFASLS